MSNAVRLRHLLQIRIAINKVFRDLHSCRTPSTSKVAETVVVKRISINHEIGSFSTKYICSNAAEHVEGSNSKPKKRIIQRSEKRVNDAIEMDKILSKVNDVESIELDVAKGRYLLTEKHMESLTPLHVSRSPYHGEPDRKYYFERDVIRLAREVHGSAEEVGRVISLSASLSLDKPRPRTSQLDQGRLAAGGQSLNVVLFAIGMNFLDTSCKLGGWYMTGSQSLLAEAMHSAADTCNQVILAVGVRISQEKPSQMYPYGKGNMRYVTSLMAGGGIFFLGCVLSITNGVSSLMHPTDLEPLSYAYMALGISALCQGSSAANAFITLRRRSQAKNISMRNYVFSSRDPSLNVVLLEDTASVVDVSFATIAISLSSFFNTPFYDSIGSIVIGVMLGSVSYPIVTSNMRNLNTRSIPDAERQQLIEMLQSDPTVAGVHDVKATIIGPEEVRLKAELDFCGQQITHAYLEGKDVQKLLIEAKQIQTEADLRAFLCQHGEGIIDQLGKEIDRLENRVKETNPQIRHIDLEAL